MGKFIRQENTIQQSNNVTTSSGITQVAASKQMIAEVKSKITIPMYFYSIIVPQLGSYYDNYPVNFDNKIVVCCPLHDEDTPSCRYYEETESFYCFGCQKGGDVIALHRYFAERMNGTKPSYEEAVSFLYDYFIRGREQETFIQQARQIDEKLNSDYDIVKFNIYRYNLEQSISFDRNIALETKEKIWNLLDNIDCLMSKDMIKADEAEKYIKDMIRNELNVDNTKAAPVKMRYTKENA